MSFVHEKILALIGRSHKEYQNNASLKRIVDHIVKQIKELLDDRSYIRID